MAVSFVVLYNCLVRGLIVQPAALWYEQRPTQGVDVNGLELFTCLYSFGEMPDTSKPISEMDADRRNTFVPVNDSEENMDELNTQLVNDYSYQVPAVSVDDNLAPLYPIRPTPSITQSLPALRSAKRNCHIIKCPKFSLPTFGSDGDRCYEFVNQCFMAVASCKRHNSRLPRLKEISRKHCDELKRKI